MPVRHRCPTAFTPWRAATEPGHFGGGGGFIDENKAEWIKIGLEIEPYLSSPQNVRSLLFGGVRRFF